MISRRHIGAGMEEDNEGQGHSEAEGPNRILGIEIDVPGLVDASKLG